MSLANVCDLSIADAYRIRVDRYDEADATPGQKLHDLPVVHSNWLTLFKKLSAAPEKQLRQPAHQPPPKP